MTSLRWEMFVQRGSHENFLCTHLKVFGLQYIFDCINSHSFFQFLALTCHSKRLLMHLWWFVWFNILYEQSVPCFRDLLIFVYPRHSFSPYTCRIAGKINHAYLFLLIASLYVFILDDRMSPWIYVYYVNNHYIRKRQVRNFYAQSHFLWISKILKLTLLFNPLLTNTFSEDWWNYTFHLYLW